jgi:hypothetical protein
MPFNGGRVSPSCLLAGFSGANRRGRTGRTIELSKRAGLKGSENLWCALGDANAMKLR